MAALLIAMLFIGVSMVSSLGDYHRLLAIHRPLGIGDSAPRVDSSRHAPLLTRTPPLPCISPRHPERIVVKFSEALLYTLFISAPARGLGHAVGRPLSDRVVRLGSPSSDPSRAPRALRRSPAKPTHILPAYLLVPHVSRAHERRPLSHIRSSRPSPLAHGPLDSARIDAIQIRGLAPRLPALHLPHNLPIFTRAKYWY